MLHAVFFDFDFTLADSSAGVTECINFALAKLGFPRVSRERACETIGLSLAETFSVLTGIDNEALATDFADRFVQRADEVMETMTHIYDSVPRAVGRLRSSELALGIVSTKFRYRIENILKRNGLSSQFDVIVGGEDVAKHKPDPSGLLRALRQLGIKSVEAVYVGDHVVDAETAERAAVPFIAVLSGICREDDFKDYQVRAFIKGIGDLAGVLGLMEAA